ncbi:hypothetical protein PHLCEN_2v4949 [Hermanssonia centrifuga]|uniref:Uncharacterized protein n=1 Tax=Hermanssonia centrifuga TaxID=98765 RepID=A0A2R6PCB3_9APHY|nr:hypothetical protein PHLCEN_2v4949 [Hermanssonia centrifuga]
MASPVPSRQSQYSPGPGRVAMGHRQHTRGVRDEVVPQEFLAVSPLLARDHLPSISRQWRTALHCPIGPPRLRCSPGQDTRCSLVFKLFFRGQLISAFVCLSPRQRGWF